MSTPLDPVGHQARIRAGAEWFEDRCALCHGIAADGNGPIAPHLRTPPADLTRIAERSAGHFDAIAVTNFIDGTLRLEAHGAPEMPVWEGIVSGSRDDATRLDRRAVVLIVEYLESVQVP